MSIEELLKKVKLAADIEGQQEVCDTSTSCEECCYEGYCTSREIKTNLLPEVVIYLQSLPVLRSTMECQEQDVLEAVSEKKEQDQEIGRLKGEIHMKRIENNRLKEAIKVLIDC